MLLVLRIFVVEIDAVESIGIDDRTQILREGARRFVREVGHARSVAVAQNRQADADSGFLQRADVDVAVVQDVPHIGVQRDAHAPLLLDPVDVGGKNIDHVEKRFAAPLATPFQSIERIVVVHLDIADSDHSRPLIGRGTCALHLHPEDTGTFRGRHSDPFGLGGQSQRYGIGFAFGESPAGLHADAQRVGLHASGADEQRSVGFQFDGRFGNGLERSSMGLIVSLQHALVVGEPKVHGLSCLSAQGDAHFARNGLVIKPQRRTGRTLRIVDRTEARSDRLDASFINSAGTNIILRARSRSQHGDSGCKAP